MSLQRMVPTYNGINTNQAQHAQLKRFHKLVIYDGTSHSDMIVRRLSLIRLARMHAYSSVCFRYHAASSSSTYAESATSAGKVSVDDTIMVHDACR